MNRNSFSTAALLASRASIGLGLCLLAASPVAAATFNVTSTKATGAGTLHDAIVAANADEVEDTITFGFAALTQVVLDGTLPPISQPLILDGYSQASTSLNTRTDDSTNARVRIELDATGLFAGQAMLQINAPATVRGIAITNIPAGRIGIRVGSEASDVLLEGNFVGVAADGTTDASSGKGIVVLGSNVQIGGGLAAQRNLISGNDEGGIELRGDGAIVQNNVIGVKKDGHTALPNGHGVTVSGAFAGENTIGGDGGLLRNVIARNTGDGVRVLGDVTGVTRILQNTYIGNGGLPIDLGDDGPTANDSNDADSGPNGLLNYPVPFFATANGGEVEVEAALLLPGDVYGVEYYLIDGEETRLMAVTNSSYVGDSYFFRIALDNDLGLPAGAKIAAAIHHLETGESSEISNAVHILPVNTKLVVTNISDSGPGSLRAAIDAANADAAMDEISFDIDAPGIIHPLEPYVVSHPVIINGYTQSPARVNTLAEGTNASVRVDIDGGQLGDTKSLFFIESGGTLLRGLSIVDAPGAAIEYGDADGGRIEGCFLGTNRFETAGIGNGRGIDTGISSNIAIGGSEPAQRNLISGNDGDGIRLSGSKSVVVGNLIGTTKNGTAALPNGGDGIRVSGDLVIIGSDEPGSAAANRILFNQGSGIAVGPLAEAVGILGNRISANGELAVDLFNDDDVQANDADDADSGSNAGQNFPEIAGVLNLPGQLQMEGTLDVPEDASEASYLFYVYGNASCDASGHGEAEEFYGVKEVVLSGDAEGFAFSLPVDVEDGIEVSVMVLDPKLGNSSELSACRTTGVVAPVCGDASLNDDLSASDALMVLKTAVGSSSCELCVCDVNESASVTASDALLVLRKAVGQLVNLDCPVCD